MEYKRKLHQVVKDIILDDKVDGKDLNQDIINDYKELNNKCKKIISKVKERKNHLNNQNGK